jgi:hypothetical protein
MVSVEAEEISSAGCSLKKRVVDDRELVRTGGGGGWRGTNFMPYYNVANATFLLHACHWLRKKFLRGNFAPPMKIPMRPNRRRRD